MALKMLSLSLLFFQLGVALRQAEDEEELDLDPNLSTGDVQAGVSHVRLATGGTSCTIAGLTNIESASECAQAFDELTYTEKQHHNLEDVEEVSYGFEPKGCYSLLFTAFSGHFARYFNKHPIGSNSFWEGRTTVNRQGSMLCRGNNSSGIEGELSTLVKDSGNSTPVINGGNSIPVKDGGNSTPVNNGGNSTPIKDQREQERVRSENVAPVQVESGGSSGLTGDTSAHVKEAPNGSAGIQAKVTLQRNGSCDSAGMVQISNPRDCSVAATQLRLFDTNARSGSWPAYPSGCIYKQKGATGGILVFNTNDGTVDCGKIASNGVDSYTCVCEGERSARVREDEQAWVPNGKDLAIISPPQEPPSSGGTVVSNSEQMRSTGAQAVPSGAGFYIKALGAQNCPTSLQINSAEDCEKAGVFVQHPFLRKVSHDKRPAGCFWAKDGRSYFNEKLGASAKSRVVGGICRVACNETCDLERYQVLQDTFGTDHLAAAVAQKVSTCNANESYVKAKGAQNCPTSARINSTDDCEKAGKFVKHPFMKKVSNPNERPAGCFWDRNGRSYFNEQLEASTTWGGVGGICRVPCCCGGTL